MTLTMADMASSRAGQDDAVATSDRPPRSPAEAAGPSLRNTSCGGCGYEQLQDPRERGALLRREGLYTSHISEWRRARDKGALDGLADSRAGGRTRQQAPLLVPCASTERSNGLL